MKSINSKNIIFITGAFVGNNSWDEWKPYFESKGYTTIAPPWPHKDASAQVLRSRHPDAKLASLGLAELIDHYADIVKKQPEKPIVIGHSLGGLIAQILLHRDLAAAGVAIHSVPPQGVLPLQFSFFKSTWKALGFFTPIKETYLMSFKDWQYAFTNGMPLKEQETAYEQLAIPESKRVVRDGVTKIARVDFKKEHAPLLLLSGSEDHTIPAALNYSNFKRYKNEKSVTEYKELKGRNHYVLGQPTWKEDADYILQWLGKN